MQNGAVTTWPRTLLQLEGAAILGSTLWAYSRTGGSWWVFAGLILLPDLGMVGYLNNNRIGAALYNLVHTETPPILMLCASVARKDMRLAGYALTWLAHIGMDRMFGFGLKYGSGFKHTHLGCM